MPSSPFPIVDGTTLDLAYRQALCPGETVTDANGHEQVLPRYFYQIDDEATARAVYAAPYFSFWELAQVDVKEAPILQTYPRFVPLAITLLAAHLSALRATLGTYVHVAANGGYRSPGHAASDVVSPHTWGTAANIYKIGDDRLNTRKAITAYSDRIRTILPGVWMRPYGPLPGSTMDHLHLDLGYLTLAPHQRP